MKKRTKLFFLINIILIVSILLAACTESTKWKTFSGDSPKNISKGNNTIVVERGDYIYYLNSYSDLSAIKSSDYNKWGNPEMGSLYRYSKKSGIKSKEKIIPKVIKIDKQNTFSIYDNWIYYSTPTNKIDDENNLIKGYVDLMRTTLDAQKTQKIATLKESGLKYSFTNKALIYLKDKQIRATLYNEEKVIDKNKLLFNDVQDLYLPSYRNYDPSKNNNLEGKFFYIVEDKAKVGANQVFMSDETGKSKLFINSDSIDKDKSFVFSIKNTNKENENINVIYSVNEIASPENLSKGLFVYQINNSFNKFDSTKQKLLSIKEFDKIYPVSFKEGAFAIDNLVFNINGKINQILSAPATTMEIQEIIKSKEGNTIYYSLDSQPFRITLGKETVAEKLSEGKIRNALVRLRVADNKVFFFSDNDRGIVYIDLSKYNNKPMDVIDISVKDALVKEKKE